MRRKLVLAMTLIVVFMGVWTVALKVLKVKASGTIYINADGSISPTAAPISTVDNVTYNVKGYIYDRIIVERNNIVFDGANYVVQGTGTGIYLSGTTNVTIKNFEIKTFLYGVYLDSTSTNNKVYGNKITNIGDCAILVYYSPNNNISRNTISKNKFGIRLYQSSHCNITKNTIIESSSYGIGLFYSSGNSVSGNNITNSQYGIWLSYSSHCTVSKNEIGNNQYGTKIQHSSDNTFYHNNFINSTTQNVDVSPSGYANMWDKDLEGNYWSDYEERYPDAEELDNSGIWDTPYIIDENNQDNYPIVPEFPSFLILPVFMIVTLAVIIYRRKHSM